MKTRPALLAALALIAAAPAQAEEKPRLSYYPVEGRTPQEIYESIRTTSPRVAPNATFAFTTIATKTDKREAKTADGCRYSKFRTSGFYIFTIPAHSAPETLTPKVKAKMAAFQAYLLKHEEGHRAMWQQCLKDYDAQALTLSAASCEKLDKLRDKAFTKIKLTCIAQDEAYDVVFRKEVLKEPFVAEALKRPRGKEK